MTRVILFSFIFYGIIDEKVEQNIETGPDHQQKEIQEEQKDETEDDEEVDDESEDIPGNCLELPFIIATLQKLHKSVIYWRFIYVPGYQKVLEITQMERSQKM